MVSLMCRDKDTNCYYNSGLELQPLLPFHARSRYTPLGIFYLLSSTRQAPLLVIPRTQAAEVWQASAIQADALA
eukprot:COSAG06_NODE_194_length_20530_cov_9.861583_6_plen_74_part_00